MKFPRPKRYKGSINYSKHKKKRGQYFVSKDRPFGNQRYAITEEEYKWCRNYKNASALWYYKHMLGTAYHFSGENQNPITKVCYK